MSHGGDAVYVACSTLCFSQIPLTEALQTLREMHFQKVDLAIHEQGTQLKPSEVAIDGDRIAQQLRATNLFFSAFHVVIEAAPAEATAQLTAVARLARLTTTPLICVPAATLGSSFDDEIERLSTWSKLVACEGVILTVETNRHTLTADPLGAIELCRRVPGLGLTLDPSHYLVGPHRPETYDHVMKYVHHVRLRDTGASEAQFQVRIGQGQLEYGRLVSQLQRLKYRRSLTVDIHDCPAPGFPVEPEVRKLKYLLESLV